MPSQKAEAPSRRQKVHPVDSSQSPGCRLWLWPAVSKNKGRLQAPRLLQGGQDQTLSPHSCLVISQVPCTSRQLNLPSATISRTVLCSAALLAGNTGVLVFSLTLQYDQEDLSAVSYREEKGQGQWAVNLRQEHILPSA